jgi:hypothetical protein
MAKATAANRRENQKWRSHGLPSGDVMRSHSGQRLDYDPIALTVLVIGIGVVAFLAMSI